MSPASVTIQGWASPDSIAAIATARASRRVAKGRPSAAWPGAPLGQMVEVSDSCHGPQRQQCSRSPDGFGRSGGAREKQMTRSSSLI